jgi:hypothetical protein
VTRLLDVPFEGGGSFIVEVDDERRGPVTRSGRQSDIVAHASQTFEQALDTLAPAFSTLVTKIRDAAGPPDEIHVEFGLKMSAEAGAIIARAGGEANFKVAVSWTRR